MERPKYKAINFDLDTNIMKEKAIYPNGYKQIKETLKDCGFVHRQGSGYVSKNKIDSLAISNALSMIISQHSWFADCVKKFDVTDVGRQYDLTKEVKNVANELKSEEMIPSHQQKNDELIEMYKDTPNYKSNVEKFGQKTANKMLAESMKYLKTQEKNGRWLSQKKQTQKTSQYNISKSSLAKGK
ncbi:MAG: hypothetical protein K2O08_00270 [Clostridia bacterium]|nr:hypothetical protein [Clostridia bacterium]